MLPTSVSQVLESICKLIVGIAAAVLLLWYTKSFSLAAGGAIFGVAGMILFIPAASVLYSLLRSDVNQRIRKKFGETVPETPETVTLSSPEETPRLPEGADVKAVAADIEANMDPRKWICVEAESKVIKSNSHIVRLVYL